MSKDLQQTQNMVNKQARRVKDVRDTLENVFNHYCKRPSWEILQQMFRLCFELGYEMARYSFYESDFLSKKDKATKVERQTESRKMKRKA